MARFRCPHCGTDLGNGSNVVSFVTTRTFSNFEDASPLSGPTWSTDWDDDTIVDVEHKCSVCGLPVTPETAKVEDEPEPAQD